MTSNFTLTFLFVFSPILIFGQYCSSNATNTADSGIDAVQLTGDVTSINNNTAGICATYTDFTGLTAADITIGGNYTIAVTLGTCGGNYSKEAVAYIDWNQDQDFDDAGEMIGRTSSTSSTATLNINFTAGGCGASALVGTTRMRIVLTEGTVPGPCGTYSWGETEDYEIFVKAGTVALNNYVLMDQAVEQGPDGCVQLTADANGQQGYAWAQNAVMDFNQPFSYDFTVNLGTNDGGADGILFVIQNDPNGTCATGVGGWGAGGIQNSLMVEIDTYLNTEDRDDGMAGVLCSGGPGPDHMDLWLNGNINPSGTCGSSPGARIIPAAIPLLDGVTDYNIENGLDHTFRINWDGSTLTATIMDITATTTYGVLTHSFDPNTVFGTMTPNFGFTASTGGLSNEHIFCAPLALLLNEKLDFDAARKGDHALLSWELKNPIVGDVYELEMSFDGMSFETIHQEVEMGNAVYQFSKAFSSGGYYFRVKHHQMDGSFYYSQVEYLEFEGDDPSFNVYPNPFTSSLRLEFPQGEAAIHALYFINQLGQEIPVDFHQTDRGIEIQSSGLAAGVYHLRVAYKMGAKLLYKSIPLVKSY